MFTISFNLDSNLSCGIVVESVKKSMVSVGVQLVLLCFSGVADAQGISRCFNALLLTNPQPCFITVFSLILTAVRDDTLMS